LAYSYNICLACSCLQLRSATVLLLSANILRRLMRELYVINTHHVHEIRKKCVAHRDEHRLQMTNNHCSIRLQGWDVHTKVTICLVAHSATRWLQEYPIVPWFSQTDGYNCLLTVCCDRLSCMVIFVIRLFCGVAYRYSIDLIKHLF